MNLNDDFAFASKKSKEWIGFESMRKHDEDNSLESSTQILQKLNNKDSNERKLEESNLMCNGTLLPKVNRYFLGTY